VVLIDSDDEGESGGGSSRQEKEEEKEQVKCPVCQRLVDASSINQHLDGCLT